MRLPSTRFILRLLSHQRSDHLRGRKFLRLSFLLCGWLFSLLVALPCLAQSPPFPKPLTFRDDTIKGDLSLTGSQVGRVENTRLVIKGNVYLTGGARLIIRQSTVEVIHYPRQEIFAFDSSLIQADTSIFKGFIHSSFDGTSRLLMNNCFLINLVALTGNARAEIRNSTLFQDKFGLVQAGGTSTALIENSVVGAIGLFLPSTFAVKIDGLRPGVFDHWSARENVSPRLGFDIILNKTEVKDNPGYSGGYEMGWNLFASSGDTLDVSNSVLNKLVINFRNEDVQFSGLTTRTPVNFSTRSIRLTNTTVQGQWGIFVENGQTTIDNCNGIWLWPVGNKRTIVTNSEINEMDPRRYTGTLTLANATMTDGFEIYDSCAFRMEGSVRMIESGPLFTSDSRVTRNFEVNIVKGSDGSPMPGIGLSLTRSGVELWRGTTDATGKVRFDVTFSASTTDANARLAALDTTFRLKKEITLKNSTPVVLGLEQIPGDARWWPVLYVDQSVSSTGIGTKGSPFKTVQEGVDESAGGGIVRVAQGSYKEEVTLGNDILLYGTGAGLSTIKGNVFAVNISGAEVRGFMITDTNTAGIHCVGSSLKIANNAIVGQPHDGIFSKRSNLTVINNVLSGNGHNGIFLGDSSTAVITNNIILSNRMTGVNADGTSKGLIRFNDIWGNSFGNYGGPVTGDGSNISADPKFRQALADDYVLQVNSPCVDKGDSTSTFNDVEDPNRAGFALWPSLGTRRNDIGAFGGALSFSHTVPLLFSPRDGSLNQPTALTLTWNTVLGASRYGLQLSTSPGFAPPLVSDTNLINASRSVGPLAPSTTYFWKVRAGSGQNAGNYSGVQMFSTVPAAPQAPSLIEPSDSAINVSLNPALSWNAVAGASSYHLQLSTGPSFSSLSVNDSSFTATTRAAGTLSLATTYYWRVRAKNESGYGSFSTTRFFSTIRTTLVESANSEIPERFALDQNYPNPFNPYTTIRFALPKKSFVSLKIFDLLGKEVATLISQQLGPGYFLVKWKATIPSGTYVYRMQARASDEGQPGHPATGSALEFSETKKMILLK